MAYRIMHTSCTPRGADWPKYSVTRSSANSERKVKIRHPQ